MEAVRVHLRQESEVNEKRVRKVRSQKRRGGGDVNSKSKNPARIMQRSGRNPH